MCVVSRVESLSLQCHSEYLFRTSNACNFRRSYIVNSMSLASPAFSSFSHFLSNHFLLNLSTLLHFRLSLLCFYFIALFIERMVNNRQQKLNKNSQKKWATTATTLSQCLVLHFFAPKYVVLILTRTDISTQFVLNEFIDMPQHSNKWFVDFS